MDSPVPITTIVVSYLLFVLKIGPKYMKNRQPYKLQNIILLYNVSQVFLSCCILYKAISIINMHGFAPKTCIMNTENVSKIVTAATTFFLMAKIMELLDTIFFVLRKKMNQVSFLHVYHHTIMVVFTWIVSKYEPSYIFAFLGMINSFVHIIMYTYYGLSSFPSLTKYLWWKKYITMMQLIQFAMIIIHFTIATLRSECSPSKIISFTVGSNVILFMYLFGKFYVDNYNKKNDAKTSNSKKVNGFKNNIHSFDTKIMQNGEKLR